MGLVNSESSIVSLSMVAFESVLPGRKVLSIFQNALRSLPFSSNVNLKYIAFNVFFGARCFGFRGLCIMPIADHQQN